MSKRKQDDRVKAEGDRDSKPAHQAGPGGKRPRKWKKQQLMGFRHSNKFNQMAPAAAVFGQGFGNNRLQGFPSPWSSGPLGGGGQPNPWMNNSRNNAPTMSFQNFDGKGANQPQQLHSANVITPMDPSSFRPLAAKYVVKETDLPADNPHRGIGARHQKLSRAVWRFFTDKQQGNAIFEQKLELWTELERVLRPRLHGTTHVFGSTLNGFAGDASDMDVCLFIDRSDYSSMSNKQARQCDVNFGQR